MIALEGHVTVIGFFEQLVAIINPMIFHVIVICWHGSSLGSVCYKTQILFLCHTIL